MPAEAIAEAPKAAPIAPVMPAPVAAPIAAPSALADSSPSPDPFEVELEQKFKAAGHGVPDASAKEGDKAKPADKPAEKVEPSKAAAKEPIKEPIKASSGPKELRERLSVVETELETERKTKAELEAKVKQYEAKGQDTDKLMALIEQSKKEKEELLAEQRMLKQEMTPEFKKQYDEPFDNAAEYAATIIKGIVKPDGTAADFSNDFVPLYRLPYAAAYAQARETFGEDAAPAVMEQVRELQKLDFVRQKAMAGEKKNWAERQKTQEAQQVEQRLRQEQTQKQQKQQYDDTLKKVSEDLRNSVEGYRDPVEDKESADLRQKDLEIFDMEPKDFNQSVMKTAHIRHRVAAFKPNQLQITRLKSEVAELKKQLEELKPSQPGNGTKSPGGENRNATESSWIDGLRKHVSG